MNKCTTQYYNNTTFKEYIQIKDKNIQKDV